MEAIDLGCVNVEKNRITIVEFSMNYGRITIVRG